MCVSDLPQAGPVAARCNAGPPGGTTPPCVSAGPAGIECSMNECIFGLAEDLDLWPPEGGGVLSPEEGHPEQNGHDPKLSTASVPSAQNQEADVKPSTRSSSHESLSTHLPPALPPRSPMTNRRKEKVKGGESDSDIRARCQSLSLHDRKGKKDAAKKQATMPEVPAEEDCTTGESHYESLDNEQLRGWAKLWRKSEPFIHVTWWCVLY